MLQYDGTNTIGTIELDDVYTGLCCAGHGWQVITLLPDRIHPDEVTVWGKCQNPDCPDVSGDDETPEGEAWRGVSGLENSELAEFLATGQRP